MPANSLSPEVDWPDDAFTLPESAVDPYNTRVYIEYHAAPFQEGGWLVCVADCVGASPSQRSAGSKRDAVRKAVRTAKNKGVPILEEARINRL